MLALKKSLIVYLSFCLTFSPWLQGNPTGGVVVAGTAHIASPTAGNVTITQTADRAIINWNGFSINAGEVTQFIQPSSASAVLNRVTGGNPSQLLGQLTANGSVFLINPNGVLVGSSGVIQTGGTFAASTRDLTDSEFIAGGTLKFIGSSANGVENLGFIKSDTGDVILVGRTVKNAATTGEIDAAQGRVALGAGDEVWLSSTGNDRLSVKLASGTTAGTGVDNAGVIKAAQAQLTAAGGNVYTLAVSNGGTIEATGIAQLPDGRIVLTSDGGDITVATTGKLKASKANGDGGTILIGGGSLGADAGVPNARKVMVQNSAQVTAIATSATGQGGQIGLWSETTTDPLGTFAARGGASGGDGGTVELGSRGSLVRFLSADVSAPAGMAGTLRYASSELNIPSSTIFNLLPNANLEFTTALAGNTGTGDINILPAGISQTTSLVNANNLTVKAARDLNVSAYIALSSQVITSDPAYASAHGISAQGTHYGDFTFSAARDINLTNDFIFSAASRAGDAAVNSTTTGIAGPDITTGEIKFMAGGNFTSSGNLSFNASTQGGAGSDIGSGTPGSVRSAGGQGGNIQFGAVSVTAAGDVSVNNLGHSATSSGGSGGRADGGGTGGAGGNITMGGLTVSAGGTLLMTGALTGQARSVGGSGGVRIGIVSPTFRDGGIGGASGDITFGQLALNATDLDLEGSINYTLTSQGGTGSNVLPNGTQSPAVVGIGGAAGDLSGGVSFTATRDILSLGSSTKITGVEFTQNGSKGPVLPADGLGGAGGAIGTATLAATTYMAGRSISSATTTNSIQSNANLTFIAGNNVTLTNAQITTSGILTVVADNAHPTGPAYGSGALSLSATQLVSSAVFAAGTLNPSGVFTGGNQSAVRLFGVDPSLVSLGVFTPVATGTANQYYGDADATTGGLYFKALIKKDPLSITANDVNLTYGFAAFPAFTASYAGLVNGDTSAAIAGLQFSTNALLGSNVGTYFIRPFGARAPGNYTLTYYDGTLTINPATLNVRADDLSKIYGATLPTLTGTASGLVNNDAQASVVTFAPTTSATLGSNVGTYTITPHAALLSSNYVLGSSTDGALTITAAPLLVSADNLSRAYGSANPPLTASFNGLVNGDNAAVVSGVNLGTTAGPASASGAYSITQSGSLSATNYTITFVPGTLVVGQPDYLTIKANNVNLTYGFSALPIFTASYSGFVNSNTASDVTGLQFFTTATLGANAGNYAITPFGATAPSNYVINYLSGMLTVNPAVLNVAANSASKTYGAALPVLTGTAAGLVNSDTPAGVVSFTPVTNATAGSNVGTYVITPGATLLSGNYVLGTVTNGSLNIGAATLNVAANNTATTYGSAIPTLTGSATGLVNNDAQTAVVSFAPTTAATLGSNAGTYVITPNATLLGASSNYIFGTITNGVLTINPAQLIVSAADATRTYGAANPAFSVSATGFVNGDTQASVVSFAPTTTAAAGANVGTYFIQPNATLLTGNYAIGTTNAGLLTITPARLDLTGNTFSMVYGDAGTPSVTATGLVNGDKLTDVAQVKYGANAYNGFVPYDFGSAYVMGYDYAINAYRPWVYSYPVLAGLLSSNYTLGAITPGTFTVTPRPVTVSLEATSLSRASRAWDNTAFPNYGNAVSGNQLTAAAYASATGRIDAFVFTFDGIKSADLAQSTVQNYSVAPKLGYVVDYVQANGQLYTGPVITGLNISSAWVAGNNYTFKWVMPTTANLHYIPSTPVTVTQYDTATITGNPSLTVLYDFTGPGLGALNGLDLSQNKFGYVTNWTQGAQSGTYWLLAKLPASIDAGNFAYPSTTTNTPGLITIPAASRSTDVPGAFWYNPQLPGTDLQITQLSPGKIKVYNTAGLLAAGNYALGEGYGISYTKDPVDDPATTASGKRTIVMYEPQVGDSDLFSSSSMYLTTSGTTRFDITGGAILGYPTYLSQEVFDAVTIFLQRAGKNSDHASVANWILQNDNVAGKNAIYGIMSEYIMNLAAAAQPTPSQQVLLNTVAGAVRNNRIDAYKQVAADYSAWQADVARAKSKQKPTLYSLIDLGEAPPNSLFAELGLAKTGLSEAELNATGAAIGVGVAAAGTAAGLSVAALSAGGWGGATALGVSGSLMPFASSGLATATVASGPAIAATFVAAVVANAAIKVGKIEQFKKDLSKLKESAYASTSVKDVLSRGTTGQAEILNALRELNGL